MARLQKVSTKFQLLTSSAVSSLSALMILMAPMRSFSARSWLDKMAAISSMRARFMGRLLLRGSRWPL